jgi:hypothetical protein
LLYSRLQWITLPSFVPAPFQGAEMQDLFFAKFVAPYALHNVFEAIGTVAKGHDIQVAFGQRSGGEEGPSSRQLQSQIDKIRASVATVSTVPPTTTSEGETGPLSAPVPGGKKKGKTPNIFSPAYKALRVP